MPLPQFTVKTLLLATAFAAISLAGMLGWCGVIEVAFGVPTLSAEGIMLTGYAAYSPLWVPLIFIGHWIGRRGLSRVSIAVFGVCEVIAFLMAR